GLAHYGSSLLLPIHGRYAAGPLRDRIGWETRRAKTWNVRKGSRGQTQSNEYDNQKHIEPRTTFVGALPQPIGSRIHQPGPRQLGSQVLIPWPKLLLEKDAEILLRGGGCRQLRIRCRLLAFRLPFILT